MDRNILDSVLTQYLEELREVIIARKSQITDVESAITMHLHFDFTRMHERRYLEDPRNLFIPEGQHVSVFHTDDQRQYLTNYFSQYGATLDGLSYFIQRNPALMLYRKISNEMVNV